MGSVNNAQFVSQSVPAVMVPGQVYAVSVSLQNVGNTTWSSANSYRLNSQNPSGNLNWGTDHASLPATVPPGASVTFNFNVTAPSTPGTYNFQWIMVRVGYLAFGAVTPNVAVAVNGTNDSQFVSQTVPATMSPSQSYPASVTLQNTGTSIWTPGNYFLGSENPQANTTWGLNRVELTAQVAPGASVTLNFNVTAPAATGAYDFQWRMVQNSTRFGAFTTNVSVNVQQAQAMTLYFVHADHLNTPRLVADATGTTVWRWDQGEPFGNNPADEDPSGLGAFDLPLRLPGQYYDEETNLHYNYFRDALDPALGRYTQFDPIGLRGGSNGFVHVSNNPLSFTDPFGLQRGGSLFLGKTLFEQLIEFITGETAKAISGAESFGNSLGDRVCRGGGVPRGPLIDCADCIRLFPEHETQEACFKGCRETIDKCTRKPGPTSGCPVPGQS